MDPLKQAIGISSSGIEAQTHRMRIISENIANSQTTGSTPGADPYSRKTLTFKAMMNNGSDLHSVGISNVGVDTRDFKTMFEPGHIAADADGMVKYPNVDLFMELADLRETTRSYEANIRATRQARELITMAVEMMRV